MGGDVPAPAGAIAACLGPDSIANTRYARPVGDAAGRNSSVRSSGTKSGHEDHFPITSGISAVRIPAGVSATVFRTTDRSSASCSGLPLSEEIACSKGVRDDQKPGRRSAPNCRGLSFVEPLTIVFPVGLHRLVNNVKKVRDPAVAG